MDQTSAIVLAVLVAILCTSFNILTLIVIVANRSLRKRTSSLPTINFLVASAIQGMIPAPLYLYRKLSYEHDNPGWVCDTYRFFYLLCGHAMQFSILLVSLDRMVAIKYPFRYDKAAIKPAMIKALATLWLVTLVVDLIPFLHGMETEWKCHFQPSRFWGLSVIVCYNIAPFVFLVVNYVIVWCVAAQFASEDELRSSHYRSGTNSEAYERSSFIGEENITGHKKSSYGTVKANIGRTLKTVQFYLEIKATKTSLVLVSVYLLCWGPLSAFYVIDHLFDGYYSRGTRNQVVRTVIKFVNFSSSILVPFCYCWLNQDFRTSARNFIFKQCYLISSPRKRRVGKTQSSLDENTNNLAMDATTYTTDGLGETYGQLNKNFIGDVTDKEV